MIQIGWSVLPLGSFYYNLADDDVEVAILPLVVISLEAFLAALWKSRLIQDLIIKKDDLRRDPFNVPLEPGITPEGDDPIHIYTAAD